MKKITSVSNPYIKELLKLQDKKTRDLENRFLIEGYHLVEEAKIANVLEEILIINESDAIENIETTLVNNEIISKLSKTKNPQSIIGVCKIESNNEIKGERLLLLDDVNDPGNLGTLIRSALGFNIDTIILSPNCVDVYNDKVIRSTQGAIFKINIVTKDLREVIKFLKSKEIKVIGTSLNKSLGLNSLDSIKKYALILGNEANGISEEVLNQTDFNIKIDINNKLESLNVAVAGAILMHYLDMKNK